MSLSVVVPYSTGCEHRQRAWEFVRSQYDDLELIVGASPPGPYNRAAAIVDAARRASSEILLVADADVLGEFAGAVEHAEHVGWAVPHKLLHRLSPESTLRLYDGEPWQGLPLSTDNAQDRRPYRGNETGTMLAIRRDVLLDVPPDVRFVGWGSEDQAWALALRTLIGPPWRGGVDLVHCWHPPQPRLNRTIGNVENRQLLSRYRRARSRRAEMRQLVDETREDVAA